MPSEDGFSVEVPTNEKGQLVLIGWFDRPRMRRKIKIDVFSRSFGTDILRQRKRENNE